MEQKVEIKGGAKISTELGSFSLIVNILHSKKTGTVSYYSTRVENNIRKSIDPSLWSQAKESVRGKSRKFCG